MKNYLLLSIMLLMAFAARSQAINKDLIYGKWNLYSANKQGVVMCLDSMEEGKTAFFKLYQQENPGEVLTAKDSAEIDAMLPGLLLQLSQSYLLFEKNGKAKAYFSMDSDKEEEEQDINRTYVWKSANEIDLLKNDKVYTSLKILLLTPNKLVLIKMNEGEENTIVFKKG